MNAIKKLKRDFFCTLAFTGHPKIVVASTGRAGSTMLHAAIADSLIKHRFPNTHNSEFGRKLRKWSCGFVQSLDEVPNSHYVVAKTHDAYRPLPNIDCKYVFIYGDPLEAALSVQLVVEKYGQAWFDQHQANLGGVGSYSNLYKMDVLNYQSQLESWLTSHASNLICIDYEDVFAEQESLSEFLDFNVFLPPRLPRTQKPRDVDIDLDLFSRLRELKRSLKYQYLCSSPDDRAPEVRYQSYRACAS
jgi:hypothetical protein